MDYNNSNLHSSTSSTSTTVTELWLRIWFEIFEPNIIIFGLVTSSLIFLVMPRSKVAVGQSAKIYYVSIAISDSINFIDGFILFTIINDTMYAL